MALSTEFLPYIFGPGTGETLESIARKRQVAEALLARGGTPKNVGEGLTAVGNALASVILERRAAAGEKAGQAGVDPERRVERWLSGEDIDGLTGGAPSPVPGVLPSSVPGVPSPPIGRGTVDAVPPGWREGNSVAPPAGAPPVGAAGLGGAVPGLSPQSASVFAPARAPAPAPAAAPAPTGPRPFRYAGNINFELPGSSYAPVPFASGGAGRGSAPYGTWNVQHYQPPGTGALEGWPIGTTPTGKMADPRYPNAPRNEIMIHPARREDIDKILSAGCLAIPPSQWPQFRAQLQAAEKKYGPLAITLGPNGATVRPASPTDKPVSVNTFVGAAAGAIAPVRASPVPTDAMPTAPTQVASLDPSVGLPPPPTGVQKVAAALPGGGAPTAGPEMASAGMPPVSGPGMLPPPFVPPSVPTGIMPTRGVQNVAGAMAPPPPPVAPMQPPQGAPPAGGTRAPSPAVVRQALENLNNPFANAGVKAQAMEILKRADPAYQLEQKMKEAQYQNLVNPKPESQTFGNVRYEKQPNGEWKQVLVGPTDQGKTTPYTDAAKAQSDFNAGLITKEQLDKAISGQGGGPYAGTGMDAQNWNILYGADPTSREYAAAYAQITAPRSQIVTGSDGLQYAVPMPPLKLPDWVVPPGTSRPSAAGLGAPPPFTGAGPGEGAAPGPLGAATVPGGGAAPASSPLPSDIPAGSISLGAKTPTDAQLTTATFADRLLNAGPIIDQFEAAGLDWREQAKADLPGWLAGGGNALISPEFRQLAQAQRSFINAVLRRESGAVISPSEFADAQRQYLPVPGDDPQTLAQKRKEREIATEGFVRAAGPSYRRPAVAPPIKPPASFLPGDPDRERIWGVMPPNDKAQFLK